MSKSNSLWIILIDSSGSMGEPFSGDHRFGGYTETGPYRTKLDAAKDRLPREIAGLPGGDIAIVAFANEPRLLFSGPVLAYPPEPDPVTRLKAGGGTNIAGAMHYALRGLPRTSRHKFTNILIISDGLSNEGNPISAADECERQGVMVSTILIDPTEEGEWIARAISRGGRITAVTSSADFKKTLSEVKREYDEEAKGYLEPEIEQAAARQLRAETMLVKLMAVGAAVIALLTAVSEIFSGLLEKPQTAVPSTLAALAILLSALFVYLFFKKNKKLAFYMNERGDLHLPYQYGKTVRRLLKYSAAVLALLAVVNIARTDRPVPKPELAAQQGGNAVIVTVSFSAMSAKVNQCLMTRKPAWQAGSKRPLQCQEGQTEFYDTFDLSDGTIYSYSMELLDKQGATIGASSKVSIGYVQPELTVQQVSNSVVVTVKLSAMSARVHRCLMTREPAWQAGSKTPLQCQAGQTKFYDTFDLKSGTTYYYKINLLDSEGDTVGSSAKEAIEYSQNQVAQP